MVMNREFGLVGYPLIHSFSKSYFDDFFEKGGFVDCRFQNFEIDDIALIENIISSRSQLEGFSVTVPHKQSIIPYLTSLDPLAQRVGAVNCVKIIRGQFSVQIIGYNTDVIGFKKSLTLFLGDKTPKALVLGDGGASKAVCVALQEIGIDYIIISRTQSDNKITYAQITDDVFISHKLIINTTVLGMFPATSEKPDLPYHLITDEFMAFDLVYNPAETRFLSEFEARRAKFINGSEMLIYQAQAAWEIYNKLD